MVSTLGSISQGYRETCTRETTALGRYSSTRLPEETSSLSERLVKDISLTTAQNSHFLKMWHTPQMTESSIWWTRWRQMHPWRDCVAHRAKWASQWRNKPFDVGTDQVYRSDGDRVGLGYQASVVMNKILKVSVGKLLFNATMENSLTDG